MFYQSEAKKIRKSRKISLTKMTGHQKLKKVIEAKKNYSGNPVVRDKKLYKR